MHIFLSRNEVGHEGVQNLHGPFLRAGTTYASSTGRRPARIGAPVYPIWVSEEHLNRCCIVARSCGSCDEGSTCACYREYETGEQHNRERDMTSYGLTCSGQHCRGCQSSEAAKKVEGFAAGRIIMMGGQSGRNGEKGVSTFDFNDP